MRFPPYGRLRILFLRQDKLDAEPSMAREMVFSRAVRSAIRRRGKDTLLEREIALPGLPEVQSQLVAPLVARNRLLGVLCLQSAVAGRFLASDAGLIQIAARQLAASLPTLARPSKAVPVSAAPNHTAVRSRVRALDSGLKLPDIKINLETRLILSRRRLHERCEFVRLVHAGRQQLHLKVDRTLTLEELA